MAILNSGRKPDMNGIPVYVDGIYSGQRYSVIIGKIAQLHENRIWFIECKQKNMTFGNPFVIVS